MAVWSTILPIFAIVISSLNNSSANEPIVVFPANTRSERELSYCATTYSVCSVLQKRYWLPPVVFRQCRCPDRTDCPSDWVGPENPVTSHNTTTGLIPIKTGSTYSLPLNNRAQMKFCAPIYSLETCEQNQPAVVYEQQVFNANSDSSQSQTSPSLPPPTTRVSCRCPKYSQWIQQAQNHVADADTFVERTTTTYSCQSLKRCRRRAICGLITADTHSTYYQCSCSSGSLCIAKNRTLHDIQELHYRGQAYFGTCQ